MKRLCLGTLINILYYNRNNSVKVDLVCDNIASSYGVDLSEIYYERNNYDKLKAGRNNTPNEIIDAARSISAEKLSNGIKNYILPIIKDSKKEAIIFEIRDVLRNDETINWDTTERQDLSLSFLFVDEAHKISEKSGRAAYYWKILEQLARRGNFPTVIFASPNTPNPELYFDLVPEEYRKGVKKIASKYSPVCQFKYFIDMIDRKLFYYDEHVSDYFEIGHIHRIHRLPDIITRISGDSQSIIYCSSRQQVIDYAVEFARSLRTSTNDKLRKLSDEIKREVHDDCFLADLVEKGVAYHVGYLPANIRLKIEKNFEEGNLRTIFCTSTLIEGVNLPADNLFITSYKNGLSDMNEVQFRNLVGRVGRIKYNLYGNVFFVRNNPSHDRDKYINLMEKEIPDQVLATDIPKLKRSMKKMVEDLSNGDTRLSSVMDDKHVSREEYDAVRKFSLILSRDIASETASPLVQETSEYMSSSQFEQIKANYPLEKTNDDITLSYDQAVNLKKMIRSNRWMKGYPELGENDRVNFDEVVAFLIELRETFLWDDYEKRMMEKEGITHGILQKLWHGT